MIVTLDIKNESLKENFLNFIKTLDYIEIKNEKELQTPINQKDKFKDFSGLWEDREITIERIREKSWKR